MAREKLQRGDEISGRYRVLDPLGEGGMAVVYRVRHELTGQPGALKILRASVLGTEGLRAKFVQEARIGSRIASDHVVEVTDAGVEADGTPWMVMELLEGDTLAERLHRDGPLPPEELRDVLRQVCHGLGAAHRAGVVHRDLKPANVFLARSRRADVVRTVKILDFGIARLLQDAQAPGTNTLLAGTPGWMAPEQGVAGMKVSARADVWALGLLAFEMVVGEGYFPPNQGLGFDALPKATERAARLGRRELVPVWFDGWFGRCVAMDPAARFPNADAAWEAAAAWAGTAPTEVAAPPPAVAPSTPATAHALPPTLRSTPPPAAVSMPPRSQPSARRPFEWWALALGLAAVVVGATTVGALSTVRRRAEPTTVEPPPAPVPPRPAPQPRDVSRWIPRRPVALAPAPLGQHPDLAAWLVGWAARVRNARSLTEQDWAGLYSDPVDHGGRMTRARLAHHWTVRSSQGLFSYDLGRSTWFVESTTAGSPTSCAVPADSPDVMVLRLAASDTGFEDAFAVGCLPMTGTYSIRVRIVGGTPVICSEAWYDCQAYCAGCAAPGVRRWACCR